jgi:hypothetical protein
MSTFAPSNRSVFAGICEPNDPFLSLFPHRFDYIYAPHSQPGSSPEWQTERRHPLSDRLIQQGRDLYGVRFGSQTQYCLLDIDTGSPYHPQSDPLAIGRMIAALEAIGLVKYLACTSSYSGGLHLYFPFAPAQSSWKLASVVAALLESAGFLLKPGQLELFPNPKPYNADHLPTLFNAHRLPLQSGSYLLNQDFQPIWSDRQRWVQQWQWVQSHNLIDRQALQKRLKQIQRRRCQLSGKADKFLNDLNAEIELGWTDFGQTNRLLGRIAMRTYIFHSVLTGNEPLSGQALVAEIVQIARSLPGYRDWCRHQHEIEHRATEWARCVENSHYYPFGKRTAITQEPVEDSSQRSTRLKITAETTASIDQLPSWNQQQSEGARERIRNAIADLLEKEVFPATATARFRLLTQYGIGGGSLYRHCDLWHPQHLITNVESQSVEFQSIDEFRDEPIRNKSVEDDLKEKEDNHKIDLREEFKANPGSGSINSYKKMGY